MTIIELKKMMMKEKKENKIKANALMMLVDTAQKIAKQRNEEVTEKDIEQAAKKLVKIANEEIENGIKIPQEEIEIYKSFLPKMISEQEIITIIDELLKEKEYKNMGEIMKSIKNIDGINMKFASQYIKNKFKK